MAVRRIEGRHVPQARSLDTVRAVVRNASAGPVDPEKIATKVELSLRHADYHLVAATTLGLLRDVESGFEITPLGRQLLDTDPSSPAEANIFAEAIIGSPIISMIAPALLDRQKDVKIQQLIKAIQQATGLAFSTAEARAQTLLAWRRRVLNVLVGDSQLSFPALSLLPPRSSLKSVLVKDWKSFDEATLYVDTLTILIGANASGKSNALDALELLRRIALGEEFRGALQGNATQPPVRGGVEWATRCGASSFTLGAVVSSADQKYDFHYLIAIQTQPEVVLMAESLERRSTARPDRDGIMLFRTDSPSHKSSGHLVARLYNAKSGIKQEAARTTSLLRQLSGVKLRNEIAEGVDAVRSALVDILFLDPVPSRMRQYAPLSDALDPDGSNIAGVIAALSPDAQTQTQRKISEYAAKLPEPTVESIYAETVGKFKTDAMLYARERWKGGGASVEIDARGMSDGTLRFVAILGALLTRPPGSVLIVEEIDNGFHPSRANLLLQTLLELGEKRRVDIVVTTHNQALLDAVGPDLIPFVFVAHRSKQSGASRLTLLEDFEDLPRLLAGDTLGGAVASGALAKLVQSSSEG